MINKLTDYKLKTDKLGKTLASKNASKKLVSKNRY